MYDPLRNKLKVALVTIFSCLSGLGIASGIGWTNTPYSNSPMTSSEPQISQEAVPVSYTHLTLPTKRIV